MTKEERFHEEKMNRIAEAGKVLDVGGGMKFGKYLAKYKSLFDSDKYTVLDKEPGYKPDIVGDIHALPFPDQSYDAMVCNAVLEHVENPKLAVEEMYRVLKPGGKILASVPFLYPYHAEKGIYKDFYRYTRDGLNYLFRDFSSVEICPIRGFWETWFNFLPYGLNKKLGPTVGRFLDKLKEQSGNQASGFHVYAVK